MYNLLTFEKKLRNFNKNKVDLAQSDFEAMRGSHLLF